MQENLREFSKKALSTLKTACTKAAGGLKNAAFILIPVIMLLSVGIIALTQEEPFQVSDFSGGEEADAQQDIYYDYETDRVIPEWVKPARWFRSNSGGMLLEEMKSRIAAIRCEYALVIDFTSSYDLPETLLDYYDEKFFIEVRTLYKDGIEDRTQWIFRDENFGVRLNAVLFDVQQDTESGNIKAVVIQNTDDDSIEIDEAVQLTETQDNVDNEEAKTEITVTPAGRQDPAGGFIEIYDEKYHLTDEYRYLENGEKSKIKYFYNDNIKTSARTMLWDGDKRDYIQTYTDYYYYNRSSFLRSVERVFLRDQQITSAENVVANNIIKVSFPHNILAAAKSNFIMSEKFNAYPDFFGDIFVLKDSKLIYTTDDRGRVLAQTLINNDEDKKVIWKIENTWLDDRIVKITKTEGDTVLLAEYEYNKSGDRVLERNIKDGVLERVVRSEGKTDIEELYLDNKIVLQAVWEDGRKISESRIIRN